MLLQLKFKRIQWMVLLFAGAIAFGFAYLFVDASFTLAGRGASHSGVVWSAFSGIFCILLGIINVMLAYGFRYGEVSEVGGSFEQPVIVKNGHVIDVRSRILFSNNIDTDDADLLPSQRQVIFFCGRRFWVCPSSSFLPSK